MKWSFSKNCNLSDWKITYFMYPYFSWKKIILGDSKFFFPKWIENISSWSHYSVSMEKLWLKKLDISDCFFKMKYFPENCEMVHLSIGKD